MSLLDQIIAPLATGFGARSHKVAVIQALREKPSLHPDVMAKYWPSNLPFRCKGLENVVVTLTGGEEQSEMVRSDFRAHHSTS